jgi:hypothetical protein
MDSIRSHGGAPWTIPQIAQVRRTGMGIKSTLSIAESTDRVGPRAESVDRPADHNGGDNPALTRGY